MGILPWAGQNWFELLQTLGIVAGLFFTAYSLRKEQRAREIGNSMVVSGLHHEIWSEVYAYPKLLRVLETKPDLKGEPISGSEELFVNNLLVHLSTAYRALRQNEFVRMDGLQEDVKAFFSLPIPREVWQRIRSFHDKNFVDFIDSLLG